MKYKWGQNRQSIRLREFDYSAEGMYYITLVTQDREEVFGTVRHAMMHLSPAGEMVRKAWIGIQRYDSRISLDEFIVMPNHMHGILFIAGRGRCPAPTISLSSIVRRFKSWTTNQYMWDVRTLGWPPFRKRLWQRNYYDHVVGTDRDLRGIRKYIRDNPNNWGNDPENPSHS